MLGVSRVIVGGYNKLFTKPTEEANKRIKICNSCEFRKKLGKIDYCSICYCEIEAKCNSPEERCLKGKG